MAKAKGLQEKHMQAIKLLAEGTLKKQEIAKQCGFSIDYFYRLCEGSPKEAPISLQFKEALDKHKAEIHKDVKKLTRINKKLALKLLNQRLLDLEKKGVKGNSRELTTILNSLNKATPNVEIDQLNQFNSMTPQEIFNEFRRLSAVARDAKRKGVPVSEQGRSDEVSGAIESRKRLLAESEDSEV